MTKTLKKPIIILGAGPAGMAAAYELTKAGKKVILVEKDKEVGGLSKTLQFGEFKTDIGPHRFITKNQQLNEFMKELLGEHWIKVNRLTRFYIQGKFFLYPLDLKNVFSNVSPFFMAKVLSDYIYQRIKSIFKRKSPSSFEEQVISDFGKTLAEFNILNYTEKVWGIPPSQISKDWAKQRIKNLSLKEIIKDILFKNKGKRAKTLVNQFYYPDEGNSLIYEKMKKEILNTKNGKLMLNAQPIEIHHNGKKITRVIISDRKGNKEEIIPSYVVSSIPITTFLNLLKPEPPKKVLEASKKLKYRSHISLFITINKDSVFPDQWVYFPEKEVPFGRISEPKNFSKKMSPQGKTSLLIEFFCWEGDEIWNADKKKLLDLSLPWLEKFGFIKREDIINAYVHKEKYAYPVYDLEYKQHRDTILNYLNKFENLILIGRSGMFKYNNQDHALEMGFLAAKSIVHGKRYDIDKIGSEDEYLEK